MAILSLSLLQSLFSAARKDTLQAVSDQADEVLPVFGVSDSRTRLAYFMAQLAHESGGLRIFEENLNYSAERLTEVWSKRFPSLAAAKPFAKNPQALGNKVYANRMGNGDEASGDGFRYRGRGFIQITGKSNYEAIGKITGLDLVGDPDQAADPDSMLLVACGFWKANNLNRFADQGNFTGLTQAINGGLNGLDDRRAWLKKITQIFNADGIGPEDVGKAGAAMQPPPPPAGGVVAGGQPQRPPPPPVENVLKLGSHGEQVRALQLALKNLGYQPGTVDGIFGTLTAREVLSFQLNNDLKTTGAVDGAFWAAMSNPKPLPLDSHRVTATKDDLKKLGSQTVLEGDRTKWLGWIATALGGLGIGNSAITNMANSATATGANALGVSPEPATLLKDIIKLLPPDALAGNPALQKFAETISTLPLTGSGGGLKTIFDVLPSFFEKGVLNTGAGGLAQIAASIIPGFGGSALITVLGVVLSYLGKRVVERRLEDHRTAANTGK